MAWKPTKAAHLIILALKEVGKPYRLGAEAPLGANDVPEWDCSELVQHMLHRAGVTQVTDARGRATAIADYDGAARQFRATRPIPFDEGRKLPGALLFVKHATLYKDKPDYIGHVGISLGNGYVLEARGRQYGVTIGPVRPSFNLAAKVAELYTGV